MARGTEDFVATFVATLSNGPSSAKVGDKGCDEDLESVFLGQTLHT
jgi:hypothetical protein